MAAAVCAVVVAALAGAISGTSTVEPSRPGGDAARLPATPHGAAAPSHRTSTTANRPLPRYIADLLGAPAADTGDYGAASLPGDLSGLVTLRSPHDQQVRAGFRLLDAPAAARRSHEHGARYATGDYDVVQVVDGTELREFTVVHRRQGMRTWRWQLVTTDAQPPRIDASGEVIFANGARIKAPFTTDAADRPVGPKLHWQLDGMVLSLRVDDASLPLPYVIDPDITAPLVRIHDVLSSSQFVHIESGAPTTVWVNGNESGSFDVRALACDPDSSVQQVTFPGGGAGWTPGADSNVAAGAPASCPPNRFHARYWQVDSSYAGMSGTAGPQIPMRAPDWEGQDTPYSQISSTSSQPWPTGMPSSHPPVTADYFILVAEAILVAPETGLYTFRMASDDGARLYLNGNLRIDQWSPHATRFDGWQETFNAGDQVSVRIEYYERTTGAALSFQYARPSSGACSWTDFTGGGNTSDSFGGTCLWEQSSIFGYSAYSQSYAWTSGADDPGMLGVVATNPDGAVSNPAPLGIRADSDPPAGGTIDHPASWYDGASAAVTFTTGADTGSGVRSWRLQRRSAPASAGACGAWGPWTDEGAASLTSPYTDASIADATCYEYQLLVRDNVRNEAAVVPGYELRVDRTPPTGTVDGPVGQTAGVATVTGTAADGVSGVARVDVRYDDDGGSSGDVCLDAATPTSWSCPWDTTGLPDGTYTITSTIADEAGNTTDVTRSVIVDNTAPVTTINSLVPVTGLQHQHVDGTTLYYNPDFTGSFTAFVDAIDAGVGTDRVDFPDIDGAGALWTPAGGTDASGPSPYELTYSWSAGATSTGTQTVTATDLIGNSEDVTFAVVPDDQEPAGGSVSYPLSWYNGTSALVSFATGSDGGSGINGWTLQRREAPVTLGTCGAWGAWADEGAVDLASPYTDPALANETCYQYRVLVRDNVQNEGVVEPGLDMIIDRTDPTGSIDNPTAGIGSAGTVDGTAADGLSGVERVDVRFDDGAGNAGDICLDPSPATAWSCSWDTTGVPEGTYTITSSIRDNAGNTADVTRSMLVDRTAPVTTVNALVPVTGLQHQHVSGTTLYYNPGFSGSFTARISVVDAGVGPHRVEFPDIDGAGTLWTPAGGTDDTGPSPFEFTYTWASGATSTGVQTATAYDLVGNGATTSFTVTEDGDPPTGGSITYPNQYVSPLDVVVTFTTGSDAISGVGSWQLQRRQALLDEGTCATWGGWADHGAANLASPYNDVTVVPGTCYQYRLVVSDNVGNATTWDVAATSRVDIANVNVDQPDGSTDVAEGGAPDTIFLRLQTIPTEPVTVTITGSAQVDIAPAVLTFTPADWNVPQQVTVSAVDDFVAEGAHGATLTMAVTSDDTYYNGLSVDPVSVAITDNDTAGLVVTEPGGSTDVAEGGAPDTFTVRLSSQPLSNVTVTLPANPQLTLSSTTLVFTPGTWNVAQSVTVNAVDDAVYEGPHVATITPTLASADPMYGGLVVPGIAVSIADNDFADMIVAETGGTTLVGEGGVTDSVSVVLTSQPLGNVTVTVTTTGQVTPSLATITFTPSNWNVPRSVTLTAIDDFVTEGAHSDVVTFTASSADASYAGMQRTVTVSIIDNEFPDVVITQSGGTTNVSESGASDTYTMVLDSMPTDDVTITLSNAAAQLTTTPATLTFTTANWNVPQQVTVAAVDDLVVEGTHTSAIAHAVTSNDPAYDGIPIASVTVTITDNDAASVTVTESGGSTLVSENGATDTYAVVLGAQPAAPVSITVSPDSQLTVNPQVLVFTPLDWNVPQVVTVGAFDDARVEPTHTGVVWHTASSTVGPYDGLAIASVTATVTDNDVASVQLRQSNGFTQVAEGRTGDTYTLVLTSQPETDVTVWVRPGRQLRTSPLRVTFSPTNWSVPRVVRLGAVDDRVYEQWHADRITHVTTSSDINYHGARVPAVRVRIRDNDVPVLVRKPTGATLVSEDGLAATYTLVLSGRPRSNVIVRIRPDRQMRVSRRQVVFTPRNWYFPQTIVVTAVNDRRREGRHHGMVRHSMASRHRAFHRKPVLPIRAIISDND